MGMKRKRAKPYHLGTVRNLLKFCTKCGNMKPHRDNDQGLAACVICGTVN